MFVDNGGALWLSDPSVVVLVLAGVVGLVYWCHRWLETGSMPTPRTMAVRHLRHSSTERSRTLREKLEARPSLAANVRLARGERPLARTRRTPQQAA